MNLDYFTPFYRYNWRLFVNSLLFILLFSACIPTKNSKSASSKNLVSASQLSLNIYPDTLTPKANSSVSLIVEAKNDGPGAIANILLKNPCPSGSSYNGSFSLLGTYNEVAESWSISSLNANESISLVLRCFIPDTLLGRTLLSTLVKTSSLPSIGASSLSVMSAKMTVVPSVANISTSLSVNKNYPLAGEQLVFKIKILNNGPDPASSVMGNYACPQGTTYLGHQLSGGVSYSSASGNLIAGDVGNGAAVELSLKCLVNIGTTTISQTITKASTTSLDNSTSGDSLGLSTSLHAQCSGSYG